MNGIEITTADRRFADKRTLAERYGVSSRTISNWMSTGLLAFFKVKRVLRFDVAACDAALRHHGYINHF
jgi:hypothetical protein